MRSRLRAFVLAAAAAGAAVTVAAAALGSDEAGFKELEIRYKKAAKNRDDAGNRDRRRILLEAFAYRDLKPCRKLLRDAYGDEVLSDLRIFVVQSLAATGDPKDVDFLLTAFKKERMAGPQIALGRGLGYTDVAQAATISAYLAGLVTKQKGEPLRSILEGIGTLADPAAYPGLAALPAFGEKNDKLTKPEQFERLIALGSCGREKACAALATAATASDADFRLAAALGLGQTGGPDQPPAADSLPTLTALVADSDPRVVEAAANALAATKHEAAVKPLIEALRTQTFRTREAVRAALQAITGRDAGHDADAWEKAGGTAPPPKIPTVEGLPFASDRVALILDLSRSMAWNGRIGRAQGVLADAIHALPDDAYFGVVAAGRTPVVQSDKLATGGSAKIAAEEWFRKQLTAGGCDLREALNYVLRTWPSVDTIVLATDSAPFGESAEDTSFDVIEEFRRDARIRRVRVFVAFTCPGGRVEASETDADEYADRKEILKQFAEGSGGKFKAIE